MHVAFIVTRADSIGGAQIHVRDMAFRLLPDGHRVSVLTGSEGPLTDILQDAGVEVRILPHLVRPMNPLKDFLAILEARIHLKDLKPDIVSTHTAKAGLVGRLAAWSLGIPSIFTAHGWQFAEGISWFQRIIVESLERFTARICRRIITVSEYDRELALRRKVVPPEKIITIHNGMPDVSPELVRWLSHTGDIYSFPSPQSEPESEHPSAVKSILQTSTPAAPPPAEPQNDPSAQAGIPHSGSGFGVTAPGGLASPGGPTSSSGVASEREGASTRELAFHHETGFPSEAASPKESAFPGGSASRPASPDPVRLIMVARLQPQKDHPTLFRALSGLQDRNWTLELVGDGPDRESLQNLARDLGLTDRVIFSGQRLDVPQRLKEADVFVLATRWEGFPRSILEAMRAGLPVVATDVGGCRESVVDGETGFLVPKEDPLELRDRIRILIDSPELRTRMGQKGRKRFEENFLFERMYQRTLEVYREAKGSSV